MSLALNYIISGAQTKADTFFSEMLSSILSRSYHTDVVLRGHLSADFNY